MSTLVTIAAGDLISNSRTDINGNFTALNNEKIETSYLDTDTALTANSDVKIPSQKAVKAYVDTFTSPLASTTAKGVVEEATSAEMIAGTGAGSTGARLFLNPTLVAETGADKIVKTKSTGLLDSSIVPGYVATPFFYQRIAITPMTTSGNLNSAASNSDGSVLVMYTNATNELFRYARDANTGMFYQTHQVNQAAIGNTNFASIVIVGSYAYLFVDGGNDIDCYRYDLATLANETAMTVPTIDTSGSNFAVATWTDGTFIYLVQSNAATTGYKLSISGTTLSTSATSTTAAAYSTDGSVSYCFDGTNNYSVTVNTNSIVVKKASDIYFAASTTTTILAGTESGATPCSITIPISTNRMYIGYFVEEFNATAQTRVIMVLTPFTKP